MTWPADQEYERDRAAHHPGDNRVEHDGEREPDDGGSNAMEALQRALDTAYRYLNRRDRTEAEVRQRLEQSGTPAGALDEAINILREQRVIDDERYARLFVEDKRSLEQWGSDRIRRALRNRGVDRDLVEQALSEEDDSSPDELARAVALLRGRFPTPPEDRRERDRALGVMLRKGYDPEVAIDALAAYAKGSSEG